MSGGRLLRGTVSCLLAAMTVITGATSSFAASSAGGFGTNATGTVTFWYRAAGNFAKYYGPIASQFNAAHPGLKVDAIGVSDSDFITKLATSIRAGDPPDLVAADDVDSLIFITKNEFYNLTKYVNALPYKSALSPGALALATYGGQIYGVPSISDASFVWYNKALFTKAGLDPNTPPTSLAQVLADAKKIRALGPQYYGFTFAGDCAGCLTFTVVPSVYAAGSDVFKGSPPHQTATIANNSALKAVLQFYRDVWTEGLVPASDRTDNGSTWGKDFLTGDVGMMPSGYFIGPELSGALAKEVGIFPIPGPTGSYSTYDGGANYGVPAAAKNPSGAWEFVQYAISVASQKQTPLGGIEPINTGVLTPAFDAQYPLVAKIASYLAKGHAPYTVAHDALFNGPGQPWQEMFNEAVFSGNMNAALQQGQSGFSSVLSALQS
jgi:multiple sugar transport system substrate-binding protein